MFKLTNEVPENINIMSLYRSLIQNILYYIYIFHISFSNFSIDKECHLYPNFVDRMIIIIFTCIYMYIIWTV